LHMQLRQLRLKSSAWERLRGVLMEKTGSNMEEEGRGVENNRGQGGKQKRIKPKSRSRKALERTQSQRFDLIKGAGKEGHIAVECRADKGSSLFGVSTMTTRGNFARTLPSQASQF